ncbi:MAG: hypothetical protein KC800_16445 [Candidatus Eremiobacteraeota bacterium]|nr:hypothetical protein [Candidatus Eremiobacteraeota bacterium]
MIRISSQIEAIHKRIGKSGPEYWVDSNGDGKRQDDEGILVKRSDDRWEPVRNLEDSINREELSSNYGLWADRQTTRKDGVWPFRKEVVDRPLNGEIEDDEVVQFASAHEGRDIYLGSEITRESSTGTLYLESVGATLMDRGHTTDWEAQAFWNAAQEVESLWKIAGA